MTKRSAIAVLCLCLAAAAAFAADPGITVEKAWARAVPAPGATGVVYLTIVNAGAGADRLTAVSTPAAAEAGLHVMALEGTTMQMRPVDALDVKPGQRIELKPGGLHIMLTKVARPLKPGEHFPLTLAFEKAGRVAVEVRVLPLGASGYP